MILILYMIMCLIFGTTFMFIKTGLELGWSPFLFSSLRFILAGVILLIFLSRKGGKVSIEQHVKIFICSLLMTTVPFGALYYSEQYIHSGESAILVATSPIFILLFQYLQKREGVRLHQVAGALICLAGISVLVMKDFSLTMEIHSTVAKFLMILGEIAFAYGTLQSKALLEKMEATFKFNALQMLYGGVGLVMIALLKREPFSLPKNLSGYILLFYFVIIASIVANGIFFLLVKKTNAFFPATWTYLSPIIALILGRIVLKEQLGLNGILGALLVILGVLLANTTLIEKLFKQRESGKPRPMDRSSG